MKQLQRPWSVLRLPLLLLFQKKACRRLQPSLRMLRRSGFLLMLLLLFLLQRQLLLQQIHRPSLLPKL